MNSTSFDPSRQIRIRIRINAWQTLLIEYLEDGESSGVDITTQQFEFFLKKHPGARTKDLSLTNNSGLTFPAYTTNEILITITAAQSRLEEGEYYWEFRRRDIDRPHLNGWADVTFGPQDSQN